MENNWHHSLSIPTLMLLFPVTVIGQSDTLDASTKPRVLSQEMADVTAGSQRIVDVLLDASNNCPVWKHARGGTNTFARPLKTHEE
tara:strand:+ start:2369 stop:2626 length:258 start_codon:yes stop_codon:yes gene_type:complete